MRLRPARRGGAWQVLAALAVLGKKKSLVS